MDAERIRRLVSVAIWIERQGRCTVIEAHVRKDAGLVGVDARAATAPVEAGGFLRRNCAK